MARYGIPYMGSKNSIAQDIVNLLPPRDNLYDLFCGGCAITHCAIENNKFKNYYINDLREGQAQFFVDCINGKYKNETRWIDRETFIKEHMADPYISCVWSFGNKGYSYIYGKEIEPLKKALHYAIVFNDYSLLKELGYDTPNFSDIESMSERRKGLCNYMKKTYKSLNTTMQSMLNLERLQNLESLQSLESLNEINLSDGITNRMHATCLDYSQVKIKPNSVIYCDIPYENTQRYISSLKGFDYERFYNWACSQKELVVISSYEIKDGRFICVFEKEKLSLLNQHAIKEQEKERLVKVERLYILKKQLKLWNNHNEFKKQLNIFDLLGE